MPHHRTPTNPGPPTSGPSSCPRRNHVKKINAFGGSIAAFTAVSFAPSALLLVALLVASTACLVRWYANLSPAQWRAFERIVRAWRQR